MTPPTTNPLHLYRHLLRETTYFFDTSARTYFTNYIQSTFRDKAAVFKSKQSLQNDHHARTLEEQHQLKRGRKLLSTLHRANNGHITPLTNVLQWTYGRKGRRRRKLMAELMLQEPTDPIDATSPLSKDNATPSQPLGTSLVLPPKFDALLRSQAAIQSYLSSNRKLKPRPVYAEKNSQGEPMPASRIRNVSRKWYSRTAAILQPHLSQAEYEGIHAKANGENLSVKPRRPLGGISVFASGDGDDDLIASLLAGPPKHKTRRERRLEGKPHSLTPRFLRRLYARAVLKETPVAMAVSLTSAGVTSSTGTETDTPENKPRRPAADIIFTWDAGPKTSIQTRKLDDGDVQASALFG